MYYLMLITSDYHIIKRLYKLGLVNLAVSDWIGKRGGWVFSFTPSYTFHGQQTANSNKNKNKVYPSDKISQE